MVPFLALAVLAFLLFLYWRLRNRQNRLISENEISFFSDIGFTGFHREETWKELNLKLKTGIPDQNGWVCLTPGLGIELWGKPGDREPLAATPFYRETEIPVISLEWVPGRDDDGFERFTAYGADLVAEKIPPVQNGNGSFFLTGFGTELTLYDSVGMYESENKAVFRKQIISLSALKRQDQGEAWIPAAETVFSGLVMDYDKIKNPETGSEFWVIRTDIGQDHPLVIAADSRLTGRFPQKGNVLVGQIYLMASESCKENL
ncbi:MAG: hypothetical protein L6Q77_06580 [Bacteroidetes bacterium]|nr:hypothetical protein [Bacteroidota bacterium]